VNLFAHDAAAAVESAYGTHKHDAYIHRSVTSATNNTAATITASTINIDVRVADT